MHDFVRVWPEAQVAVAVHVWVEPWCLAIGWERAFAGQRPAHVLGSRADVGHAAGAEFHALCVRDGFDDAGCIADSVQMLLQKGFVEGKDAFEFDAEGDIQLLVRHLVEKGGCLGDDSVRWIVGVLYI